MNTAEYRKTISCMLCEIHQEYILMDGESLVNSVGNNSLLHPEKKVFIIQLNINKSNPFLTYMQWRITKPYTFKIASIQTNNLTTKRIFNISFRVSFKILQIIIIDRSWAKLLSQTVTFYIFRNKLRVFTQYCTICSQALLDKHRIKWSLTSLKVKYRWAHTMLSGPLWCCPWATGGRVSAAGLVAYPFRGHPVCRFGQFYDGGKVGGCAARFLVAQNHTLCLSGRWNSFRRAFATTSWPCHTCSCYSWG